VCASPALGAIRFNRQILPSCRNLPQPTVVEWLGRSDCPAAKGRPPAVDESKCNMARIRDSANVVPNHGGEDDHVTEDFETIEALTKLCAEWSKLLHEMVENGTPPTAAAEAMLTVALDATRCLETSSEASELLDLVSSSTPNAALIHPASTVRH
jgi:hypothetical protein